MTTVDLGATGEDNTFGRGRIDVVEAYAALMNMMVNSNGKVEITGDASCSSTLQFRVAD